MMENKGYVALAVIYKCTRLKGPYFLNGKQGRNENFADSLYLFSIKN
jgi:hypothetical protein